MSGLLPPQPPHSYYMIKFIRWTDNRPLSTPLPLVIQSRLAIGHCCSQNCNWPGGSATLGGVNQVGSSYLAQKGTGPEKPKPLNIAGSPPAL